MFIINKIRKKFIEDDNISILDKNKPILIIAHYFSKKGPNMEFGKIFSKIFHIIVIYGIIMLNLFLGPF